MNHALVSLDLGSQVRKLRNKRGLTLQDLADLTGLSKPNLSQIENNLVTPPIATLLKISSALGVGIGFFFKESEPDRDIVVVRREDRTGIAKGPHVSQIGYQYEPLAYPKVEKMMEPFIVHMEERAAEDIVYNNHRGEEFLYVLNGTLEFHRGETTVTLNQGDSLYFDSSLPHGYRGVGGTVITLVVIYRPD
ncbi:helix-turn-helix domain-containing protein [Desulforhopalus singaporensis]|uniref:Transcriptional regulator, XRE family with cupin sensor n=1 Tax=Desulforhopalus singaporensis TaxID=91360 RepID=A0A1H0LA13_9BACT|nr:XRE family transcriptional regulator [Desulforhopalus singaporensis]SDO64843.1 transcriptional regulator, XRE family with cupin sensor [Desulforhopalus singaporensis]